MRESAAAGGAWRAIRVSASRNRSPGIGWRSVPRAWRIAARVPAMASAQRPARAASTARRAAPGQRRPSERGETVEHVARVVVVEEAAGGDELELGTVVTMDPRAPRDQLRDSSAAQKEMAKVVRRRIYVEVFAGDVLEGA